MKLQSDLIPHEKFHKGFWLKTEQCPWFFFYEAPREYKIPKNKNFYSTLDDDLKNLVIHLHSKKFFYHNPTYKLPLKKNDFLEELRKYQRKGVLGFVDNQNLYHKLKHEIPVDRYDDVTLIMTEGKTQNQISRNWKNIEKIIKGLN